MSARVGFAGAGAGISVITFLTDFGLEDDFVGTCHGVIAGIAPDARVIDVTHGIAPQAVLTGALVLRSTTPFMPVGVHLAVVDPDVGGNRRAVAVQTRDGRVFVGPDNGLLMLAADDAGVSAVHELTAERYRLQNVSRTFHARDVFAPAAAHLATGTAVSALGPALDPESLIRIDVPEPQVGRTQISATVLVVDRFGNVSTNARRSHVDGLGVHDGDRVEIRLTLDRYYAVVARTFADAPAGELIVYEDSNGFVTLAISHGDAARLTGVTAGDEIRIAQP
jgi:S-adenosylmethionine hydrolase